MDRDESVSGLRLTFTPVDQLWWKYRSLQHRVQPRRSRPAGVKEELQTDKHKEADVTESQRRRKADYVSLSHFPGCLCGVVWRVQTSSQFLVPEDSVWTGCTGSCWDHTGTPVHTEITASAAVPLTATRCCCDQTDWNAAVDVWP